MFLKSYKIQASGINFHLKFKSRLTLIDGKSGLGKTMLFKHIQDDALANNQNIICLDYHDLNNGNVDMVLNNVTGKIIVIDKAEIVLSVQQRLKISFESDNQYIIFTHNYYGFKPGGKSLATLKIEGNKGYLSYEL